VTTAKDEMLSELAAQKYLNEVLLPKAGKAIIDMYRIRPNAQGVFNIAKSTASLWMKACGAIAGKFKQCYYNDNHEADFVILDRSKRYIPAMDNDELKQPLWAQIPRSEYDKLAVAQSNEQDGSTLPPPRHAYMDKSGVAMVEMHVDDSDFFDKYRVHHPLGGSFSMRWDGRPTTPPSAPPLCLPNPAADTLEDTPAEAELEDAAEAAAEGADAQLGEPVEKITRTNVANGRKPWLRDRCDERNLQLDPKATRGDMQQALLNHMASPQAQLASTGAVGEEAAEESDEESNEESDDTSRVHVVDQISDRCASLSSSSTQPRPRARICERFICTLPGERLTASSSTGSRGRGTTTSRGSRRSICNSAPKARRLLLQPKYSGPRVCLWAP